ncbi:5-formyltetrahydrofolate cyclo-ligase [uncultured Algimonas sp.]|uniref:5-formyltetrahydrofolate cyclo-ligase n=1 Tax=uncultured Algimonas sp. TaxID=1547920 RepID=UPI0026339B6D|nr:5-formyltetrahydrofolate cyclo-ligase [uncultured Algimonas sp.]
MSLATRKAQARERARAVRATLSADPKDFVRHWPGLEPSAVIAGYWPINSEVDVRPLLEKLAATHRIVLPVTPRDRLHLSFRRWTPGAAMEAGPFGTQHPVGALGDGADPLVPDVVMVPLLAFTRRGDRLGYGGGYYDATLAELKAGNPGLRSVGVAFSGQMVNALPLEETDMALDHVLTENGLLTTRL